MKLHMNFHMKFHRKNLISYEISYEIYTSYEIVILPMKFHRKLGAKPTFRDVGLHSSTYLYPYKKNTSSFYFDEILVEICLLCSKLMKREVVSGWQVHAQPRLVGFSPKSIGGGCILSRWQHASTYSLPTNSKKQSFAS